MLTRHVAEKRHDPVTQELVHRSIVLVHGLQDDVEGSLHDLADLLGIEPLGQGGEAGDVREEHAHLFALTARAEQVAASTAVLQTSQPLEGAPETTRPR